MLRFPVSGKDTTMGWQMWPELTYSSRSQLLKRLLTAAAAHAPGSAGQWKIKTPQRFLSLRRGSLKLGGFP